jgi:hypothetical protein
MAIMLSEVALQRVIQIGLRTIRNNPEAFKCIFEQYNCEEMRSSYGATYIDKIFNWFNTTKIPVVQAWSFDTSKVPGISIHLADESEDESKASVGDFWGMGEDNDIKTGVVSVSLDIGIHADKSKDHVLWLYYIIIYVLYKEKPLARKLGLQLFTFRANDYNKESRYMADNVWSRWVRFRCTVQHYVDADEYIIPNITLDIDAAQQTGSNIVDTSDNQIDSE